MASVVGLASCAAMASDGKVTFTGNVTSSTCEFTSTNGDLAVTLPTVSNTSLLTPGATAGDTQFTIPLKDCTQGTASGSPSHVKAYFEAGPTVNYTTGRLVNSSTATAKNVEIELLDSTGTSITIGQPNSTQGTLFTTVNATPSTNALVYIARYYATAAVTAGTVSTSVMYTLVYN